MTARSRSVPLKGPRKNHPDLEGIRSTREPLRGQVVYSCKMGLRALLKLQGSPIVRRTLDGKLVADDFVPFGRKNLGQYRPDPLPKPYVRDSARKRVQKVAGPLSGRQWSRLRKRLRRFGKGQVKGVNVVME